MVENNTSPTGTPFTVPVDHRSCHTGISAAERARTVHADPRPELAARGLPHARPPVRAGGEGRRRAAARRPHRGDRRSGAPRRPHAGGRAVRDLQPRGSRHGRRRGAPGDRRGVLDADRLDRRRDPLPARARAAGPPRSRRRRRAADALRQRPRHRLPRRSREPGAGRLRVRRSHRGRGAAGAHALVLLHRRPAQLAALRLRRPAADGAASASARSAPASWSTCRRKGAASA